MKKKLIILSACLVLVMSLSLVACSGKNHALSSVNDVYGLGAVSTVKLLGGNMSANAIKTFSDFSCSNYCSNNGIVADNTEYDVKEQVENFNEYFTALNSFLGEDIVKTTTQKNNDTNFSYENKMEINGKDVSGKNVTFTMYYTEELVETSSEDAKIESQYKLDGVMIIDGVTYYLEGSRSIEDEKDETETELKLIAFADKNDKSSYVQMEQEISFENNETETQYVYSIYCNNELVEQTAVEFETERKNNKVETQYELEFKNGDGKGKYEVSREVKNNIAKIKVKYNINGNVGVFSIREISNANGIMKYEYTFNDGSKKVL